MRQETAERQTEDCSKQLLPHISGYFKIFFPRLCFTGDYSVALKEAMYLHTPQTFFLMGSSLQSPFCTNMLTLQIFSNTLPSCFTRLSECSKIIILTTGTMSSSFLMTKWVVDGWDEES